MKATYSPEDNKLRLYPSERLNKEDYERFKKAGFKWAPEQKLFVAPMWTPGRFDLLLEFCGEVGDEDQSLVDRAEERAGRFEGYSDKRAADAKAAHRAVKSITDNIPFGQPILVGHHSERRARKDAERIENGMRKAVNMWETSKYWEQRAAGAIRAAKYKDRPDVRARRIKKLGADMRKQERNKKDSELQIKLWSAEGLTQEQAETIAGGFYYSHQIYCDLRDKKISIQDVKERCLRTSERAIKYADRWIEHYKNRIAYETAMLDQQGATGLLKQPPKKKHAPVCNYDGEVTLRGMYGNPPKTLKMHPMTKAEYAKINKDYKGCCYAADGSHRVRVALLDEGIGKRFYAPVFLTDSKVHDIPPPPEPEQSKAPRPATPRQTYQKPERTVFDDLKDQLKTGVEVVSAPQLFVTPASLAERMVDLAGIDESSRVLEPSAGTGAIVSIIKKTGANITAVEIDNALASGLKREVNSLYQGDFLECNGSLGAFDAVIMNPPFANGQDIKHICHALTMLKDGGRLIAICADGPRQNEKLKPIVEEMGGTWERLPAGTFKESGTMVNTVLMKVMV